MKNKKSLLALVLVALILVLGVGYAAVSSIGLTINGTANVKGSTLAVSFTDATSVSDAEKVTATATNGSLSANITVKDLELNDTVTATYTIQNKESDVKAKITEGTHSVTNSDYFQVTTDIGTGKEIQVGGEIEVTITVKLIKTPVTDDQSSSNITINLEANAAQ